MPEKKKSVYNFYKMFFPSTTADNLDECLMMKQSIYFQTFKLIPEYAMKKDSSKQLQAWQFIPKYSPLIDNTCQRDVV